MNRDVRLEALVAGVIAADLCIRRVTISETTRRTFQTHTEVGRRVFCGAAGAAVGVFIGHIIHRHP